MGEENVDKDFPCCLFVILVYVTLVQLTKVDRILSVPLPSYRLASSALRALQVDAELSPLVRRSFSLHIPEESRTVSSANGNYIHELSISTPESHKGNGDQRNSEGKNMTILRTEYRATTNRMLRVAVNGFMESLGLVLVVMEELDVDVLAEQD